MANLLIVDSWRLKARLFFGLSLLIWAATPSWCVSPGEIGAFGSPTWMLDRNFNFVWNGAPPDGSYYWSLGGGEVAVYGDWNGDGRTKIGVYLNGTWLLDYNGNGVWDGPGVDKLIYSGGPGYQPLVGDWNRTGYAKIGAYQAASGTFLIDYNGNWAWDGPGIDRSVYWGLGTTGEVPVIGDWNGSGSAKIGVYSGQNGDWVLDYNGNYAWDGPSTDRLVAWTLTSGAPVVGDWNGTGTAKIGIYANGTWLVDFNGNFVYDGPDKLAFFGGSSFVPVVGDWGGTGASKIAAYASGSWVVDVDGSYTWNPPVDISTFFGGPGQTPVVGRWSLAPAPLSATCSASPANPAVGAQIVFAATVSGGTPPYSYNWTGAVSGTGANASTYSALGAYQASLAVVDSSSPLKNATASCSATTTNPLGNQVIAGQSYLHTNLGIMVPDWYLSAHQPSEFTPGLQASCPGATTIRSCVQQRLAAFRSQGITGVRTTFQLCGGSMSTALLHCDNASQVTLSQAWVDSVSALMQDIASAGIANVSFTIAHHDDGDAGIRVVSANGLSVPSGQPCQVKHSDGQMLPTSWVKFYPADPVGLDADDQEHNPSNPSQSVGYPLDDGFNGYNCSYSNPYFVGWANINKAVKAILDAAHSAGLGLTEVDYEAEVNFNGFPVETRYVVDNSRPETGEPQFVDGSYYDELKAVRALVSGYSSPAYDSRRVTYSAALEPIWWSGSVPPNCQNAYGGYARLTHLYAIGSAIGGGQVGTAAGVDPGTEGGLLPCGGDWSTMVHAPLGHTEQPNVVDIHAYPCNLAPDSVYSSNVNPAQEGHRFCHPGANAKVQVEAKTNFDDLTHYLNWIGTPDALVIVGETHGNGNGANSPSPATGYPISYPRDDNRTFGIPDGPMVGSECIIRAPLDVAAQMIAGYNASTVAGPNRAIIFRPFVTLADATGCTSPPANQNLNAPDAGGVRQGPLRPANQ